MNAKLTRNGEIRWTIKVDKSLIRNINSGVLGPITSRNTRYIFMTSKKAAGFYELGEIDLNTGNLLRTDEYGADNTRDAQIVIDAALEI